MPRPSSNDPEILIAVARKVLAAMPAGTVQAGDEDGAINDIAKAIRGESDEYRMAKRLDDLGWDCDREIADALEVAAFGFHEAVREATKEWVEANGIRPRLTVGAAVRVKVYTPAARGRVEYDGEIVAVLADYAQYLVIVPTLGHVREGVGTHGIYVNFEDLHSLADTPEQFALTTQ